MLDVRMDRFALNRPRTDERDLDGEVVDRLGARAQKALHLGATLDLEVADSICALDLLVDLLVVERDSGKVDRRAPQPRDLVDAVLDRRQHPEAEQVDLEEAGVCARVLVPSVQTRSLPKKVRDKKTK